MTAHSAAPAISAGRWKSGLRETVAALPDRLVLGALLLLATAVRVPGIEGRGRFDSDQGYEMLILYRLVHEGTLPLLGTKTSVGDFHQGALYYLLLAPVAVLSDASPLALVLAIAVAGVATVAVTWWLARAIAGPMAGLIAGLLISLSPAAIETSTFMWSANPMPFFAAAAFAAAWRAHATGRRRWWIAALVAAGAVWQLHLLGVVLLVPVAGLLAYDVWRARSSDNQSEVRRLLRAGAAGLALIGLLFVPLAIHELQSGFAESQRILAYLTSGAGGDRAELPATLAIVALRTLAWPVGGLITESPGLAFVGFAAVVTAGAWGLYRSAGQTRLALAWLAGSVAWTIAALSIVAPGLASVTPGLPNDHYHSFVLPAVIAILAAGLAALGRRAAMAAAIVVIALLAVQVARWPAASDAAGGWPAVRESGARVAALTSGGQLALLSVPSFKPAYATQYSLLVAGSRLVDEVAAADYVVVPCDRLFEPVVGLPCGGAAEDAALRGAAAGRGELVARFMASSRTWLSVYRR
jgi:4-amino-4-deoxy-L-arabinose transferase-like glycosyltransferase